MNSLEFRRIEPQDPCFREILKLRYKVYCAERGFEREDDHAGGLESDQYDDHSVHFAAIVKRSQRVVGTVRLILDSCEGFPVESSFEVTKNLFPLQKEHIAEVSRLAVSRSCCYDFQYGSRGRSRFDRSSLVHGLLRCVAQESLELGITHLYAVMARGLPVLLRREQIFFTRIGPEKEYHGLRAPYILVLSDVLSHHCDVLMHDSIHSGVAAVG